MFLVFSRLSSFLERIFQQKSFEPVWPKEVKETLETFSSHGFKKLERPLPTQENNNYFGSYFNRYPQVEKYDYELYFNKRDMSIEGIVFFGKKLEGPKNRVHGGALSSICDAIMGTTVWACENDGVTLNLNVNYRKFVNTNSFLRVFTKITKVDGRKIFVSCSLSSLNNEIVHVESTSLYYVFSKRKGCSEFDDYGFNFKKFKFYMRGRNLTSYKKNTQKKNTVVKIF